MNSALSHIGHGCGQVRDHARDGRLRENRLAGIGMGTDSGKRIKPIHASGLGSKASPREGDVISAVTPEPSPKVEIGEGI